MAGKLSALSCKSAPIGKHSDGGGLYLQVTDKGKYWRGAYRFEGKQKTSAYGTYPAVSLSEIQKTKLRNWLKLHKNNNPVLPCCIQFCLAMYPLKDEQKGKQTFCVKLSLGTEKGRTMRLREIVIKQAKLPEKSKKLFDGGGLFLYLTPSGKYWYYRYRYAGKDKVMPLGKYPDVNLRPLQNPQKIH